MRKERGNKSLKLVDRYLGIPLILVLTAVKPVVRLMRRAFKGAKPSGSPAVIGLLATGAIGDLIIASSIFKDLREALPDARLILFVSNTNAAAVDLIGSVDDTVELPITRPLEALALLRRQQLDWLLDCGPWARINAIITALSRAERTVGFKAAKQFRHFLYDYPIAHRATRHQIDNLRALLQPLGLEGRNMPAVRTENMPLSELPDRFVIFHPWPGGYRSEFKRWPLERWMALGKEISQRGWPIVLTGGPADAGASAKLATRMREQGVRVIDTAGKFCLGETAAMLRRADAVVTVDTGILHLAAAVNARVIGLHGPTHSRRWGGLGPRVISINAEGSDSGYLDLGFEYPRKPPDCMGRISIDQVLAAVLQQIANQRVQTSGDRAAAT